MQPDNIPTMQMTMPFFILIRANASREVEGTRLLVSDNLLGLVGSYGCPVTISI